MAAKKQKLESNPVLDRLDAIHSTLQDMFILQARLAGLSKSRARAIVGVADARVSRIWREVGATNEE